MVSDEEMIFDVGLSVVTVEVKSPFVPVEECVNSVVSDATVDNNDGSIEVLAVVIGWTDEIANDDVIISELCSEIDDDDGKDELSIELDAVMIVAVPTSVSNEDVAVSIEVACDCDVDANDKYSLDCGVFSPLVLEIPFVAVEIYSFVDISDPIDEVRSLWVVKRVVNIDVSDEIELVFTVVAVTVDSSFACWVEYSVDSSNMDVTTVEVTVDNVTEDVSAVVALKVTIVVCLVDINNDEDRVEYSVEVETSSLVVVIVLVKDSVVPKLSVDTADV